MNSLGERLAPLDRSWSVAVHQPRAVGLSHPGGFSRLHRRWAIDALARRYNRRDVEDILSRSIGCALRHGDLPRAVEVGALREYCYNAWEFEEDAVEALLHAQLAVAPDDYLRARLHAGRDDLAVGELALLAEAEAASGNDGGVDRCYCDLIDRLRAPRSRERETAPAGWAADVTPLLATAALPGGPEPTEIAALAALNRRDAAACAFTMSPSRASARSTRPPTVACS